MAARSMLPTTGYSRFLFFGMIYINIYTHMYRFTFITAVSFIYESVTTCLWQVLQSLICVWNGHVGARPMLSLLATFSRLIFGQYDVLILAGCVLSARQCYAGFVNHWCCHPHTTTMHIRTRGDTHCGSLVSRCNTCWCRWKLSNWEAAV